MLTFMVSTSVLTRFVGLMLSRISAFHQYVRSAKHGLLVFIYWCHSLRFYTHNGFAKLPTMHLGHANTTNINPNSTWHDTHDKSRHVTTRHGTCL